MSIVDHTVLVAVDMSEFGTLALDSAIDLVAARSQAELHVIHVLRMNPIVEPPLPRELEQAGQSLRAHIADRLEAAEDRGVVPSGRVVAHIASGNVATEIVQLATNLHADVIALGTHGRTGVERLIIGSVAEYVVRTAPCPVLVLRQKDFSAAQAEVEPPCPRCLEVRASTQGQELWCATHSEQRARRHTYFSVKQDTGRHSPISGGIA